MRTDNIEYFDGEQKLIGKFFDNGSKNSATIILFHAFEGLSDFTLHYAERLVKEGYHVFVADMYGNGEVAHTIEGCFNLIRPFLEDRALVRRRAKLALDIVRTLPINQENIGAMGFCFGGMCMLELARSGAIFKAGVSAHGVLTKSQLPTETIHSRLLILHGYEDPQVPPTTLTPFAEEMQAVADWTFIFFGHAKHSYTDPATGTYDPTKEHEMGREYNAIAAERTFRYSVDFFNEQLKD